jgi:hypothetical protein
VRAAAKAICDNRALLGDPDPTPPLISQAADELRERLNKAYATWRTAWDAGEQTLAQDENWKRLSPEQKHQIRENNCLLALTEPQVDKPEALVGSLEQCSLARWASEASACSARVAEALAEAALHFEPKTQRVTLGRRTIKNDAELESWLEEVRAAILAGLKQGPVMPQF